MAEVDRQLDRVIGPNARRRIEPGDDGSAGAVGDDLREVPGFFRLDEAFEHVFDEDGLGVDLDVHELFGA